MASFSRPGNLYDNAKADANWNTLKTELSPHSGVLSNLKEARIEVAYYLDTYSNLNRRHCAPGYGSQNQFETDLLNYLS